MKERTRLHAQAQIDPKVKELLDQLKPRSTPKVYFNTKVVLEGLKAMDQLPADFDLGYKL